MKCPEWLPDEWLYYPSFGSCMFCENKAERAISIKTNNQQIRICKRLVYEWCRKASCDFHMNNQIFSSSVYDVWRTDGKELPVGSFLRATFSP